MTFPSYCDQVRPSDQSSARTGSIVRRIWHHQAGTNDDATIAAMVSGSKEVSANQTVDNKPPADQPERLHARITGVVHTEERAWTSSSAIADGRAMTTEVANSSGPPGYGISEASYAACALIAARDFLELGIPLKRATKDDPTGHMGHSEVTEFFGQGYPTACPLHLDIDRIIRDGQAIVDSEEPAIKRRRPPMSYLIKEQKIATCYGFEKPAGTDPLVQIGPGALGAAASAGVTVYDAPALEFQIELRRRGKAYVDKDLRPVPFTPEFVAKLPAGERPFCINVGGVAVYRPN